VTRIELTRPAGARPTSVRATAESLTRHLHANVRPSGVTFGDQSMTVTYTVVAPVADVRRACAAVVHEPVTWEVAA
jgi:hypothetical protein